MRTIISKQDALQWLNIALVVSLVVSNIANSVVQDLGISILGVPMLIPVGTLAYSITFLITDITGEIYGKQESLKMVNRGFVAQIYASVFLAIPLFISSADADIKDAYNAIFSTNWLFVIASLAAYYVSQSIDVYLFHFIRDKLKARPKLKWVWNNTATLTSQLVDTIIFTAIPFGIGMQWFWSQEGIKMFAGAVIGQYLIKALYALLDTPFFYFFTKKQ